MWLVNTIYMGAVFERNTNEKIKTLLLYYAVIMHNTLFAIMYGWVLGRQSKRKCRTPEDALNHPIHRRWAIQAPG